MSHAFLLVLVPGDTKPEDVHAAVEGLIAPYDEGIEVDALAAHPGKDSPASDCDSCGGTGKAKSTYNPKSKWDWWVIGGRYDGLVKGERRDDGDGGFNFGEAHHQPRFNVAPASEVIAKIGTDDEVGFFALVTPDGEWHERGRLGWWGNVRGEKDDWDVGKNQLLRAHPNCLIVGVDYHI
jgi:hypothetical protein